ncbi:MAG TPA: TonB family protein, partial [Vicinamibacteria bacterium]|nr:TonB family protein [Vicinamibacteria bacterium]
FFDTLLDSKGAGRPRRKLTLPVSIAVHVLILGAVLLVPLLRYNELPEPVMSGAIRAFLVEAAPAPPPPPPPPAAAMSTPRTVTAPKIEEPKPVTDEPKFTAPIETPREEPKPDPAVAPDFGGPGEPGGEVGGVPGGVKGGTEGGVVGGTIGGVAGGELGGVGGVAGGGDTGEPAKPTAPVRVGGNIHAPAKLNNVPPIYPPVAKQARVEGTVILEATISPQGRVTELKVLRGIPLLDGAAVNAVRQWSYSPTLLNGSPVSVVMTVTVNFHLAGNGASSASAVNSKGPVFAPDAAPATETAPATEPTPPPSR